MSTAILGSSKLPSDWITPGVFWLVAGIVASAALFGDGLDALLTAWSLPEYSHGPLIPVLSGLLFLRQLKEYPIDPGPKRKRWIGACVVLASLVVASVGRLADISDLVAYATIIWIGGILLISFGWDTGKHFWPPVLHLVYMLPLPSVLYFKVNTYLQLISSELGVWFLRLLDVPVFLEGNVIDLGVYKLLVAEACSGLRYLFPILSFSYIFAVLYKGPSWHKAVLLVSAAPITVVMNSVRIAIAGVLVQELGLEWLEGFTHFFEGWVIFLACILLLFGLARLMLLFHPQKPSLGEALDLEFAGLVPQASRLKHVRASRSMVFAMLATAAAAVTWQIIPERSAIEVDRTPFSLFPRQLGDWKQVGQPRSLEESVETVLAADDYHSITLVSPTEDQHVSLFTAYYVDQSVNGVHSPEVCLPGGGWEIAWLERTDLRETLGLEAPVMVNRAIIQRGTKRMIAYYWFEQRGRKIAWDIAVKYWLTVDGITSRRRDGGLVRLITPMLKDESDAAAEARLQSVFTEVVGVMPRFIPE